MTFRAFIGGTRYRVTVSEDGTITIEEILRPEA